MKEQLVVVDSVADGLGLPHSKTILNDARSKVTVLGLWENVGGCLPWGTRFPWKDRCCRENDFNEDSFHLKVCVNQKVSIPVEKKKRNQMQKYKIN